MFLITAFILGILVSLNPCQIAINLSAITFMKKQTNENEQHNNNMYPNIGKISGVWIYVIGKALTYTLLGWLICWGIGNGETILQNPHIQNIWEWTERLTPYILILIGLYMFYRAFHRHEHHGDSCHNSGKIIHNRRKFPPIILGMLLALAFCPESAIMYFSLFTLETSWLSSLLFSIGAAIPIVVMGYAIEKSANKFDELQNKFKRLQRWINILVGSVFIIFAVYLLINH